MRMIETQPPAALQKNEPRPSAARTRSVFCGHQRRYTIPLKCRSAFPFYLDHLALPHSLAEVIWINLARRWQRLARIFFQFQGRTRQSHTSGFEAALQQLNLESRRHLKKWGPLFLLTCSYGDGPGLNRTVSFVFSDSSPVPTAVAKLGCGPAHAAALRHEYETLQMLSSRLGSRSANLLPQPLDIIEKAPWTILLETWLPGRTAYFETRNSWNPLQHASSHFRFALEWLLEFQKATGIKAMDLNQSAAIEYVIQPLKEFAFRMKPSSAECRLIEKTEELAQRLLGTKLFLMAGHGDFWSGNLVIGTGSAGVVDWEHFRREVLPFEDLFLFPTAYGMSYPWKPGNRVAPPAAFRATYLQATPIADEVRKFLLTYCSATGLATELLELFFPVFLASRALEGCDSQAAWSRHATMPLGNAEMWRYLFRIYAERAEPPCFIDRRKKWSGAACVR